MSSLGANIRLARKQKGLTLEELAFSIGTTKSTISKYELGRREPTIETIQHIATALDTSVFDLLGATPRGSIAEQQKNLEGIISQLLQQSANLDPDEALKMLYYFQQVDGTLRLAVNTAFDALNEAGQQVAVERVEELTHIPKYQKTTTD